jgi:hypothetical protein
MSATRMCKTLDVSLLRYLMSDRESICTGFSTESVQIRLPPYHSQLFHLSTLKYGSRRYRFASGGASGILR